MIKNKSDYKKYLMADKKALNIKSRFPRPIVDDIWRFERILRKLEYYLNCKKGFFNKIYILYIKYRFHKISKSLGFDIPVNVFGPGLSIAHRGTIVVNGKARVGKNCRLHACTNIGTANDNFAQVPQIGDNVYIGPGAKIYGDIIIADGIAIGANSVVNKSFIIPNKTIAGVPAKMINNNGSENLLFPSMLSNKTDEWNFDK
ncbi:serine acetyltransferase [Niallia sp. FSL W8-0635]|uniref:serine acetyltransferase n=1 Tax=Niallia sp. FSL W8-0635 TaxID=2975337 RepID=UPI0030FC7E4E